MVSKLNDSHIPIPCHAIFRCHSKRALPFIEVWCCSH